MRLEGQMIKTKKFGSPNSSITINNVRLVHQLKQRLVDNIFVGHD